MSHLRLVPRPVRRKLSDLPPDIRADLDEVVTAIEQKILMWDVAGYGLRAIRPEFITVVQRGTSRTFDIDIRHIHKRSRTTDEFIDVLFDHYGLR